VTDHVEVDAFALVIDGRPKGQPRPRFANGRAYAGKPQKLAEDEIRRVWLQAGAPRMVDGPLALHMVLRVARPAGHFRRDGSLSAEGLRTPWPLKTKPDVDNAIKLLCDALNTRAWRDDVRFCTAYVARHWINSGEWPRTEIDVRLLP
jgi:Holliday junction resolvase RusA-like endonuclease